MSRIKSLSFEGSPAGIQCWVLANALRMFCLLAILGTAGHAWAQEARFTIETNSPGSWSAYYMHTGLGAVDAMPLPTGLANPLAGHCRWLTKHTDQSWFPLGYSVELGFKICYRTGPFSEVEAETYCGRLDMGVIENNRRVIVCGGKWAAHR